MIVIEGFIGKQISSNGDWKAYSFYPNKESMNLVKVHEKYRNISISGIMPTFVEKIKYKLGIEESEDMRFKNSYVFKQMFMEENLTQDFKNKFLQSQVTERQYESIIQVYPNLVDMIIKDEPIDTSKIKGIGDITMDKIKEKVTENFVLAGLVAEYSEYGMTFEMLKKLHDKYKSTELIKEKMEKEPYKCLCAISGVGFIKADGYILNKFPQFIDTETRCRACIDFIMSKNESDGNTWITYANLYRQVKELASQTSHHVNNILENKDSNGIEKDEFFEEYYYHKPTKRVSKKRTYLCEREVCNMLLAFNERKTILNLGWEDFNMIDGFPLSEEQRQILRNTCVNNLNLLVGFGGTGKSFSTKALVEMLEANMITYLLMSPTGKASKVLRDNTGRIATTIHRGLKYSPRDGFFFNKENRLPQDVIIIDEFSMIDVFLLRDLLRAIRDDAKIIFIGDPEQIPSVGAGNIAYDMLQSNIIPTSRLTQVFRYGEGGLSYVVSEIREGRYCYTSEDRIQTFGKNKDYVFVNSPKEAIIPSLKQLYNKLLKQGVSVEDIMVLTAQNVGEFGTAKVNAIIQEMVNPQNGKKAEFKVKRDNEDVIFRLGDKVMQVKNDYKIKTIYGEEYPIMNGDVGTIVNIVDEDEIHIEFDGRICLYSKTGLGKMLLAYSMSIHKSQGSQSPYVILLTPDAHTFQLNRNLLYVGTGRTKKLLYHIGSLKLMKICLKKSENRNRDTWLLEMLRGEV